MLMLLAIQGLTSRLSLSYTMKRAAVLYTMCFLFHILLSLTSRLSFSYTMKHAAVLFTMCFLFRILLSLQIARQVSISAAAAPSAFEHGP